MEPNKPPEGADLARYELIPALSLLLMDRSCDEQRRC
jgi:hypothetical protein